MIYQTRKTQPDKCFVLPQNHTIRNQKIIFHTREQDRQRYSRRLKNRSITQQDYRQYNIRVMHDIMKLNALLSMIQYLRAIDHIKIRSQPIFFFFYHCSKTESYNPRKIWQFIYILSHERNICNRWNSVHQIY